ncbi:MAG: respiratory nitrate reductase subunit gamma [Bacteroidales bacterium]|nr:respiratory nitrate reductase subunit gamma [Bacteroidales bacterium]
MNFLNTFLFIVLPYISLAVFLTGTLYRYKNAKYSYTSLSSQFLENKKLFWGSQAFHWGIVFLFFGHLVGFLFPKTVIAFNNQPVRIMIIEGAAFIAGLLTLFGILVLIIRRLTDARLRKVTTKMDWTIEGILLLEIVLGIFIALSYRWGSSWFASVLSPYLKSIFTLNPQIQAINAAPLMLKLHIAGFFLLLILIPFSRLGHLLLYPIRYAWRPYQRVIWYSNRKKILK